MQVWKHQLHESGWDLSQVKSQLGLNTYFLGITIPKKKQKPLEGYLVHSSAVLYYGQPHRAVNMSEKMNEGSQTLKNTDWHLT